MMETPTKMIPAIEDSNSAIAPSPAVDPAGQIDENGVEPVEEIETLGPCSFAECEDFAVHRCEWKNQGRLTNRGCKEVYCASHGYVPEKANEPVCCLNCEKAFNNDTMRVKMVFVLGISIILLIFLVSLIFFAVTQEDNSDGEILLSPPENTISPTKIDINADTVTEEDAAPYFDDTATPDMKEFS